MKKTARINLLAPLAGLALLFGTGCIVHEDLHDADIDFNWDCNGARCSDVGVMTTVIELDGPETSSTETPIAADGVSLQGYLPGTYGYHIVGLTPSRTVLYETFGSATMHSGLNVFNVTLHPPQ